MSVLDNILIKSDDNRTIIRQSVAASVGVGLIPVPVFDVAALVGVQLSMISRIAKNYNVEFKENYGRNIIFSVLGSAIPHGLSFGLLGSALKAVPFVGSIFGFASFSIFAGATTFTLGKVLTKHFEHGGTLLNFNLKEYEADVQDAMKEGKTVAKKTAKK